MFSKQGLIRRVAATQGEEADTLVFKVNLRTDEAMRPVGSDVKSTFEPANPPRNRAMESARLWEPRQEAGGVPTAFGKRLPAPTRVSHSYHSAC